MNLGYGFHACNTMKNKNKRTTYAKALRDKYLVNDATVGALHDQKNRAQIESGKAWTSLTKWIDELAENGKHFRKDDDPQCQFLTHFSDAVYLIDKYNIDTNKKIGDLILTNDEFIEASTHLKEIHNKLMFSKKYAQEF